MGLVVAPFSPRTLVGAPHALLSARGGARRVRRKAWERNSSRGCGPPRGLHKQHTAKLTRKKSLMETPQEEEAYLKNHETADAALGIERPEVEVVAQHG